MKALETAGYGIGVTVRQLHEGSLLLADGRLGAWLWAAGPAWLPARAAAAVSGLAYASGLLAPATPGLVPAATAAWCAAAWRAARRAERQQAAENAFLTLLGDAIGDRNGVLLSDVLLLLHRDEMLTGWTVTDLRRQCEALGVPVRDSLKVDGRVSIGVHRDDLCTVHPTPPPPHSATPPEGGSPQATSPTTPKRTPIVEGVAWTVHAPPVGEAATHLQPH